MPGGRPRSVFLVGQKFGSLSVVAEAERHGTQARWNCVCDCGMLCTVQGGPLRNGKQTTCGHRDRHYQGGQPIKVVGKKNARCYWATLNGEVRTIREWSEVTGLARNLILQRFHSGWDIERILTEPANAWIYRNKNDIATPLSYYYHCELCDSVVRTSAPVRITCGKCEAPMSCFVSDRQEEQETDNEEDMDFSEYFRQAFGEEFKGEYIA